MPLVLQLMAFQQCCRPQFRARSMWQGEGQRKVEVTLSPLLTSWILDSWVVGEFGWRRSSEGFAHYTINRYTTVLLLLMVRMVVTLFNDETEAWSLA